MPNHNAYDDCRVTEEIMKDRNHKNAITRVKNAAVDVIDINGDGKVDIEDILTTSMKMPGVTVNREAFLRKEFFKYYPKDIIDDIVNNNPAHAGITVDEIEGIANHVIQYERNKVSGLALALGMPGGLAMAATIPADVAQYYGHMLIVAQKLLYLYGFPEIAMNEKGQKLDSETMNILLICLGVMNGAAGANAAVKAMAHAFAKGVEKKLIDAALTKGVIFPIVKNVLKWFGVKLTKDMFAGFFKKIIPVVGGVVGGGITYSIFKPCCTKLKESLEDTYLSNVNHVCTPEEEALVAQFESETTDDSESE